MHEADGREHRSLGDDRMLDAEEHLPLLLDAAELDAEMAAVEGVFTPWFKMQWRRLQSDYADWF